MITLILDRGKSRNIFNITTHNLFLEFWYSEKHFQGKDELVSTAETAEDKLPSYSREKGGLSPVIHFFQF